MKQEEKEVQFCVYESNTSQFGERQSLRLWTVKKLPGHAHILWVIIEKISNF